MKIKLTCPRSLTLRMMVFVALTIGVSMLLISQLVLKAVERHFAEQDADELRVMTETIYQRLQEFSVQEGSGMPPVVLARAVSGHHGVYYRVQSDTGDILYISPGADFSALDSFPAVQDKIDTNNLVGWQSENKSYRGASVFKRVGTKSYLISTAMDMEFHQQFLENFRNSLAIIMTLAGIATLVAVWLGVHQGLSPLRQLSSRVRSIGVDRLDSRLDVEAVPAELRELVLAFNQMLDGLDQSFTRLSHFSDDIAHELRTPLTNLITQTQVSLGQKRSLDEYRELLYSNLEEQERLSKMVNDMLWLAKSEHGLIKPVLEPVDLCQEIRALFEFFEALAEEKQVSLVLEGEAPAIKGDRAMLRQAFSNLLSNAVRFTPEKKCVLVRVSIEDTTNRVLLCIENPGDKIADEHLGKLFDRFYQVDPSRSSQGEGAGLGLAIVKSIIEAHGGQIEALSSERSNQFVISLPTKPSH